MAMSAKSSDYFIAELASKAPTPGGGVRCHGWRYWYGSV